MPQCVAYGCIPKIRAAAEGNDKKISYHKFPQKNQLRKHGNQEPDVQIWCSVNFPDYALHFTNESFVRDPDLK